jgi:hypothetical protein
MAHTIAHDENHPLITAFGMERFEALAHQPAEQAREHPYGEEEPIAAVDPA